FYAPCRLKVEIPVRYIETNNRFCPSQRRPYPAGGGRSADEEEDEEEYHRFSAELLHPLSILRTPTNPLRPATWAHLLTLPSQLTPTFRLR
ncbi:unnamed protein product, partial [Nesidiocoris tenuis]